MVKLICPVCYQRVQGTVFFTQYHGEKPIRCRHEEVPDHIRDRLDHYRSILAAVNRPTDVTMHLSPESWSEALTWALDQIDLLLSSREERQAASV